MRFVVCIKLLQMVHQLFFRILAILNWKYAGATNRRDGKGEKIKKLDKKLTNCSDFICSHYGYFLVFALYSTSLLLLCNC